MTNNKNRSSYELSNSIKSDISELIEKTRKEALDEVLRMLWKREQTIEKLLENGEEIFYLARRNKSIKLFEQRQKLRTKAYTLLNTINEINVLKYEN